jgi:hypothetical protein
MHPRMPNLPRGIWIFVGLVVAALILHAVAPGRAPTAVGSHHRSHSSRRSSHHAARKTSPTPPGPAAVPLVVRTRQAVAALVAAGGPKEALWVAAAPAPSGTWWALAPTPDAQGRWWFGVETQGQWRWGSVTATQSLPSWWPLAPRRVLADAQQLQSGQTNPSADVEAIPWDTITGLVNPPACWSLQTQYHSRDVSVNVVLPSRAYPTTVGYEVTTTWTPQNAQTGVANLTGIVALHAAPATWCAPS